MTTAKFAGKVNVRIGHEMTSQADNNLRQRHLPQNGHPST